MEDQRSFPTLPTYIWLKQVWLGTGVQRSGVGWCHSGLALFVSSHVSRRRFCVWICVFFEYGSACCSRMGLHVVRVLVCMLFACYLRVVSVWCSRSNIDVSLELERRNQFLGRHPFEVRTSALNPLRAHPTSQDLACLKVCTWECTGVCILEYTSYVHWIRQKVVY